MNGIVKKVRMTISVGTATALAQTSWKAVLFKNLFFHGTKERPADPKVSGPFLAMKKRFLKESL